jgi:SAM-dependent MidA family methyltransferase
MAGVAELIKEKINAHGPVSFHDYMEMALYHPGLGYYTGGKKNIGCEGDYYTSPQLTPLFGQMVAKQIVEMWYILGKNPFTIVEYGAGSGALCNHIMRQLKEIPELYKHLSYYIIEKNAQCQQEKIKPSPGNVCWASSIDDIPSTNGCILSNELLDNFPVHQVVMQDELMEIYVGYTNCFEEILKPASQQIISFLKEFNLEFPSGFRAEINLQASRWVKDIAKNLNKGFVITIDYGYLAEGFYKPDRSNGTLVCYHNHRVHYNPYIHTGEQDITTHVNFSTLQKWGIENGLTNCGYTSQGNFLAGLGITSHLREMEKKENGAHATEQQKNFLAHTLLFDMGKKFKVLVQQKGLTKPMLSGLMFG